MNESYALKASRSILNPIDQRLNEKYWVRLLDLVEHGNQVLNGATKDVAGKKLRLSSFEHINEGHIIRIKKDYRIF